MRYFVFYYKWSASGSGEGLTKMMFDGFPSKASVGRDVGAHLRATSRIYSGESYMMTITGFNEFNSKEDYEAFFGVEVVL